MFLLQAGDQGGRGLRRPARELRATRGKRGKFGAVWAKAPTRGDPGRIHVDVSPCIPPPFDEPTIVSSWSSQVVADHDELAHHATHVVAPYASVAKKPPLTFTPTVESNPAIDSGEHRAKTPRDWSTRRRRRWMFPLQDLGVFQTHLKDCRRFPRR